MQRLSVSIRFSTRMSQHCVRAQIVAYYYSLNFLLDDFPSVRQSHFVIGRAGDGHVLDPAAERCPESRYNLPKYNIIVNMNIIFPRI